MNEWKHEKAFWRKYFDRSSKWNYIPYVVTFPCLLRNLPSSTKGWSFGTATNECCWNRKWVRRQAPSVCIFRKTLPWCTIYVTHPHSWVFGVHPVGLPQVRLPLLFSLFLVLRKVFSNVFLVLSRVQLTYPHPNLTFRRSPKVRNTSRKLLNYFGHFT